MGTVLGITNSRISVKIFVTVFYQGAWVFRRRMMWGIQSS